MNNRFACNICKQSFDHWLILQVHRLSHGSGSSSTPPTNRVITSEQQQIRPSVIRYAPPSRLVVKELAHALSNSIVRHFVIDNTLNLLLEPFLENVDMLIINTLQTELERMKLLKFGLVLETSFINIEEDVSPRAFVTRSRSINNSTDIKEVVKECVQEIILKITEHEGRGSGWSLLSIKKLIIRTNKQGYGDRGSSYIPLPPKIAATRSCVNVQNTDHECFKYAMVSKFIPRGMKGHKPSRHHVKQMERYNFNSVNYPVSLNDIKKFEKRNPNVSVNVFGLDDRQNVYPMKIVDRELRDHTDLLLVKKNNNSHYVYIQNFNALVSRQLTKKKCKIIVCKRCFHFKQLKEHGQSWLLNHQRLCGKHEIARIVLPTSKNATLYFNKPSQQYRLPIVIYADFEATLKRIQGVDLLNVDESFTDRYQKHEANSFCVLLKSDLPEELLTSYELSSAAYVYRGENASKQFVDYLYAIITKIQNIYDRNMKMITLTHQQSFYHHQAQTCYLCNEPFKEGNSKVHDHDHLTGEYRGAACNSCNLNYKIPRFVPVVMHNLSGYDAHFIIPELGRDTESIDVIATTCEKFISFSKKVGKMKLRFIDSFRFMSSSLNELAKNLRIEDLIETKKIVPESKVDLVIRKGFFPYDYIDSPERFNETTLPTRELFYNSLNAAELSVEDYHHAQRVWNELNINNLGEYSDFYVTLDVTLLADVMEQFRATCISAYGLDPLHSYTSPGLAWNAMLKETKCKLKLLTDVDMLLMIESGVRGGITQCVTRHFKANNKYLPDYDSNKQSSYLAYLDANNLYGWAMSKPLPYDDFKWCNPDSIGDISLIDENGEKGYILECDVSYPDKLHDYHYDLPLLPLSEKPPNGKYPKLLTTLYNKHKYVAHYRTIQQALKLGLRVTKIHRALEFSQSCWLQPYIESNTRRRAAAKSAFEKDFFKLMNNAIFGKTLENKRKHKDLRLVSNPAKLLKLTQKSNFKSTVIINENLVAVSMGKTKVKMDRPLYAGMCILDISKTLMYHFHYDIMLNYYGREKIGICYMDTDAFKYWILTNDLYIDLRTFQHKNYFDFSDYPIDHPNYDNGVNKKVLGKFKDEANGAPLIEFVGLMSKMYAIEILREDKGCIKKAKGIKRSYLDKNMKFEDYKECLFKQKTYMAGFNTIRSFNHQLFSVTQHKRSLSTIDDKRHIRSDGINTLPYGHFVLDNITE